jgi:16S rRNA (adenine1518-N6/adenine1519-N6)-dimethyltransferase
MRVPIPPQPKRKLGQNFLYDENVIAKIIAFIRPKAMDHILEIGGGTGALTAPLAPLVQHLVVVELDPRLVPHLQSIPGVVVVQDDIRKVSICTLKQKTRWRVVGNLPYYISTSILTTLLRQRACLDDMILMFQDEVAQRIIAPPSDAEYGMLSVLAQYFCSVQKGFRISRNSFIPKPDVESRILRFQLKTGKLLDYDLFASFLADAFSQRRKKLRNNLMRTRGIEASRLDVIFASVDIPLDARAENLSAQQYETLIIRGFVA